LPPGCAHAWLRSRRWRGAGRLEAHYGASLSGIPVGKEAAIEISDDTFSASRAAPRGC
jgi:hypothetical protein